MPPDIDARLAAIETKIEAIHTSVEKTRKYFLWTLIISVIVIVLPAIGLVFALPAFLNNYVGGMQDVTKLLQ